MEKNLPSMQETRVQSHGQEDPMEKRMATHSSILAWRFPWTVEPGGLQSTASLRARHDWVTLSLSRTQAPPKPQFVISFVQQLPWKMPVTSVQFSLSVVSDSLWPHGLPCARYPCLSPTPGAYSNSCPLRKGCHPIISSPVVPFSHLQSFQHRSLFK